MDKLLIRGGRRLQGEVVISGAKNAALPEMCAALLTTDPVRLTNVPRLQDVATMRRLLQSMGMDVQTVGERGGMRFHCVGPLEPRAPYELVKTMRASILALGPLLARLGHASVSLPGGCAIGQRPVDQHISGLRAMGAEIEVAHGYMLENAAQEPEVADRAEMLIRMGARIEGHGSSRIRVQGVQRLHGCEHAVVADRIEAGTFAVAVAATGGDVLLRHARAEHLGAVLEKLREAGVRVQEENTPEGSALRVQSEGAAHLKAQNFRTSEYPGFPTDMQAQFMALNCVAQGHSAVTETIFENRFMHVNELARLGARIHVEGRTADIDGAASLTGATVMATDLRASASLVIAALVAEGQTRVDRIYHLDRGYDQMEEKLRAIGADIERVSA